jgi:uncharacterized cupin superfamily protein
MKKIDPQSAPQGRGTRYPPPHDAPCRERHWLRLGDAAGLTQFGVNLVTLEPGVWSSQRHWHEKEDEFVYMIEGELVLITDAGEEIVRPGDSVGFKAGVRDGHHFVNRSDKPARFLAIGTRDESDTGEYPDIDMRFNRTEPIFTRKNGEPF